MTEEQPSEARNRRNNERDAQLPVHSVPSIETGPRSQLQSEVCPTCTVAMLIALAPASRKLIY